MYFWCEATPFCCSLSGCRQSKAFWYALFTEFPSIISTRGTGFHPLSGQRTCIYDQHQFWEAKDLHSMDINRINLACKKYSNKWQNKNMTQSIQKNNFPGHSQWYSEIGARESKKPGGVCFKKDEENHLYLHIVKLIAMSVYFLSFHWTTVVF